MKYLVTSTSFTRNHNDNTSYQHNPYYRDEEICTDSNRLFEDCMNEYEIEDRYESVWNRLNDGYTNTVIVKVLNVVRVD